MAKRRTMEMKLQAPCSRSVLTLEDTFFSSSSTSTPSASFSPSFYVLSRDSSIWLLYTEGNTFKYFHQKSEGKKLIRRRFKQRFVDIKPRNITTHTYTHTHTSRIEYIEYIASLSKRRHRMFVDGNEIWNGNEDETNTWETRRHKKILRLRSIVPNGFTCLFKQF